MFTNKGFMRRVFLTLALVGILSSAFLAIPAYGSRMFTDVPDGHWAEKDIEKIVSAGIMEGYEDGTFRPNEKVNKVQALVTIKRLMNPSSEEIKKARGLYDNVLSKYSLKEEEKDALAVALYKGIINEKMLANEFFTNGVANDSKKLEVCLYLVRAMGLEEQTKNRPATLIFNDAELIPKEARSYIDLLIEKKVLNDNGDEKGNFNPNQSLTRALMATLLSKSYDIVSGKEVDSDVPEQPAVDTSGTVEITGNIVEKAGNFVVIQTSDKTDSYTVTNSTLISIDGKTGTLNELEKGMSIKAMVKDDNTIVTIGSEKINETFTGNIKSLSLGASPSISIEYKEENGTKTLFLSGETKVKIDGKDAYLFNLKEGDLVTVEVVNNIASKITAESKNGSVKGVLKDKKFEDGFILVVEREDKTTFEYNLNNAQLDIKRNGEKATINDIRKGDMLEIGLNYGTVASIDAESVNGEDEGIIKAVLISEEPELTILNKKNERVTYYISKDVAIKIDNQIREIYDLRLGYHAKLKLESDEIVGLDVEKKDIINEAIGTIEYINTDGKLIRIKQDVAKESISLNISDKVSIKDMDGKDVSVKDLKVGDKILATGNYDMGYFIANKIVVIK
jgi:hypothetical protein